MCSFRSQYIPKKILNEILERLNVLNIHVICYTCKEFKMIPFKVYK